MLELGFDLKHSLFTVYSFRCPLSVHFRFTQAHATLWGKVSIVLVMGHLLYDDKAKTKKNKKRVATPKSPYKEFY